jgi:hypothetical protein
MMSLKNCPFCGSECEITKKGNDYTKSRSAKVKCKKCRAERTVGAIRNDMDWCVDTSIALWNTRTPDLALLDSPEMLAMVERIISHRSASMWTAQELIREIKKATNQTGGDDAAS